MPGTPADLMPIGPDTVIRRIEQIERELRVLRSSIGRNGFVLAAGGNGIRTVDFDGTSFDDPGTTGNYFNGDGAVLNALKLRPGSIDNDILTNPLGNVFAGNSELNFAVDGTAAPFATATMTVPEGFTAGVVVVITNASVYNSSASAGFLYVGAWIGGAVSGGEAYTPIGASGGLAGRTACVIHDFPTLVPGGTIPVSTSLRTDGFTIPADAGTIANTNAFAILRRAA